jgi:hypothetical protein
MKLEISAHQAGIFEPLGVEKLNDLEFLGYEKAEIITFIHLSITFLVLIHLFYFIFMLIKQNLIKKKVPKELVKPKNLRKINECCSICLENITHEVQLLCSHSYCGKCLIDYGKQRWNLADIRCPMCRGESKLLFSHFERNEQNKEIYDIVLSYNHHTTCQHPTSFCFSLDLVRFTMFYVKELKKLSNSGIIERKRGFLFVMLLILFLVFYPLTVKFATYLEFFEDLITYVFLIVLCSEYFYRRFSSQYDNEYERVMVSINTSESQTQNDVLITEIREQSGF